MYALKAKEFQGPVGPPSLGGMVGQKHMEHLRGDRQAALRRLPALGRRRDQCGLEWSGNSEKRQVHWFPLMNRSEEEGDASY